MTAAKAQSSVGLLGGSFNPIHNGHLLLASSVLKKFDLDCIFFIPSFISPHKDQKSLAEPHHRKKMIEEAIKDHEHFFLSDYEITREGVSYSIDTIQYFEEYYGNIYFITGTDLFRDIQSWHRYNELFYHSSFIITSRPGYIEDSPELMIPPSIKGDFIPIEGHPHRFKHISGHDLRFLKINSIEVSSTDIRDKFRLGEPADEFLPETVNKYIIDNKLYTGGGS